MERFLFLTDVHFGYERRNGHKVSLHDQRAIDIALQFAADFKPHHIILGGDILDCGVISHHNHHKPGRTEGLRLITDAQECRSSLLEAFEKANASTLTYLGGNHEAWLDDFLDEHPGLDGFLSVDKLLNLAKWKVIPQGGYHKLGKLIFIHGDQISGGENAAKNAVIAYESSIRLGHFHTYQIATKTSAVDIKQGRTGVVVPCLCTKDPKYNESRPVRWMQGFNYGYLHEDGSFSDYVPLIVNNRTVVNGKVYRG